MERDDYAPLVSEMLVCHKDRRIPCTLSGTLNGKPFRYRSWNMVAAKAYADYIFDNCESCILIEDSNSPNFDGSRDCCIVVKKGYNVVVVQNFPCECPPIMATDTQVKAIEKAWLEGAEYDVQY